MLTGSNDPCTFLDRAVFRWRVGSLACAQVLVSHQQSGLDEKPALLVSLEQECL